MSNVSRITTCLMAALVVFILAAGCGDGDVEKETNEVAAEKKAHGKGTITPAYKKGASVDDAALAASLKKLSEITQPTITVGEVPEGFPSEVVPLYPGGTIERAALQPGEATVLQTSSDSEETVLKYYTDFYGGRGWKKGSFIKVGGKNLGGFEGPDCRIHMTLHIREDGETFFSLVLENA